MLLVVGRKYAAESLSAKKRGIFQAVADWAAAEKLVSLNPFSAVRDYLGRLADAIIPHCIAKEAHCATIKEKGLVACVVDVVLQV